jgi:hypothetical protein
MDCYWFGRWRDVFLFGLWLRLRCWCVVHNTVLACSARRYGEELVECQDLSMSILLSQALETRRQGVVLRVVCNISSLSALRETLVVLGDIWRSEC